MATVTGHLNPADLPSRGCTPQQLCEKRWWEGPSWLRDEPAEWPSEPVAYDENEITAERTKSTVSSLMVTENLASSDFTLFEDFERIVRQVGWMLRFKNNVRKKLKEKAADRQVTKIKEPLPLTVRMEALSVEELQTVENLILKISQMESFGDRNDALNGLTVICDEFGLLRVRTQVSNRPDAENFRFPILLSGKHVFVQRLITLQHVKSCHAGAQNLLSILREKYWILGGRRRVRAVISSCVVCKRQDAKPFVVKSPALPIDRVRDAETFEITGVDLAGPLFLRGGEKAWVCLFTCAVYRAVHLELVSSLSTASFIQAFRRFIARRGRPKTVYSDNGTNFVGAESSLASVEWEKIDRYANAQRITWKFNPPSAPWWGGFWERMVGLLKRLLRKVLGSACLDYENMNTVLCDSEAVINARPITYSYNNPSDPTPLTPAMFLGDNRASGVTDCDSVDRKSLDRKIRHAQKVRDDLRQRFRSEYLEQLKIALKKRLTRAIKIGEVVLVGSDKTKRVNWPLGRVVELIPGKDGIVRVVRIDTANGQLLRPVQRLYPLEVDSVSIKPQGEDNVDQPEGELQVDTSHQKDSEEVSDESDSAGVTSTKSAQSRVPELRTKCGRQVRKPAKYRQ